MGNRIRNLVQAVAKMSPPRQIAVGAMVLLIVVTWLAACLVLASLFAG